MQVRKKSPSLVTSLRTDRKDSAYFRRLQTTGSYNTDGFRADFKTNFQDTISRLKQIGNVVLKRSLVIRLQVDTRLTRITLPQEVA